MLIVKVLGISTAARSKLVARIDSIALDLGLQVVVKAIDDLAEIERYRVALTPALVIADTLRSSGKLPSPEQIADWLLDAALRN